MMENNSAFRGTKLFLFVGDRLAVLLRDDRPDIPDPGLWDFPGGGREKEETAETCVLRELREELGVSLTPSDLIWTRTYHAENGTSVFFAAQICASYEHDIALGDEGQDWALMRPQDYITHPRHIPRFVDRLRDYLQEAGK